MNDLQQLLEFAHAQHRAGALDQAESAYRQILTQFPNRIDVLRDLAWLLCQRGEHAGGIEAMRQAVAIQPLLADLHNDLGTLLRQAGRLDEGLSSLREAVRLNPSHWLAQFNLGNAYQQASQFAAAITCYQAALRGAPRDADVWLNLGVAQKALGQLTDARHSFEQALAMRPDHPDALINLGITYKAAGDIPTAIDCYTRALSLQPQNAQARYNLGLARMSWNDPQGAIREFAEAVRINPNYGAAFANLANAWETWGDPERARDSYQHAIRLLGQDAYRVRHVLTLPVILDSHAQIEEIRTRMADELDTLAGSSLAIVDPAVSVGTPAFALAYQGRNEVATQTRISQLLSRACPELAYLAPHCRDRSRTASKRIRLGFVSTYFQTHTIGKLNVGLLEQLDRGSFEVTLFRFADRPDDLLAQRIAQAAEVCVTLPLRLAEAQAQIAAAQLDVLFYTDIGIDGFLYYLAHSRLAPVQCVTWGHPLTTGIPTLDYFISSEDLDSTDAQSHYTESLVRLPHLVPYYLRPEVSPSQKSRSDFGLPESCNLYACLQSQFKLHPDDDAVFGEILRRDPQGRLVLLQGNFSNWTVKLLARLQRSMPDVANRVVFVEQQTPTDFSRLLASVDVLLDPLHFGGGETSYQSFAVGTPIITLPSGFMRGRITYSMYRAMGLDDLVASDPADYVARAVRLANDAAWREQTRARILERNERIFENAAGVRDLEAFLLSAVNAR